jgi:hypothetical protein
MFSSLVSARCLIGRKQISGSKHLSRPTDSAATTSAPKFQFSACVIIALDNWSQNRAGPRETPPSVQSRNRGSASSRVCLFVCLTGSKSLAPL